MLDLNSFVHSSASAIATTANSLLGAFMLSENDQDISQLAKAYFEGELGLDHEDVPEASRNLLGAFDVLYRINERLKTQQTV